MKINLLRVEFRKLFKSNYLFVYFVMLIISAVINVFSYVSQGENSNAKEYGKELQEWVFMLDLATQNSSYLSPYQEEQYNIYRKSSISKIEYLSNKEEEDVVKLLDKANVKENMFNINKGCLLFLIMLLSVNIFSKEFTSGEIYQTFTYPYRREKIYLAKIIVIQIVIFLSVFFWFIMSTALNEIICGFSSFPYFYEDGKMSEHMYYLIKYMIVYVIYVAISFLIVCYSMYLKKSVIALGATILTIILFNLFENFGMVLNWTCYSLIPTYSFSLERYILKVPYLNEIITYNNNAVTIIDDSYSLPVLILFDIVYIVIMFMCALDKYKSMEVIEV